MHSGISRHKLHKVADFLPYPFIIAEVIDGVHQNTYLNEKFLEEIGYTLNEIPTIEKWYEHAYPDLLYRNSVIYSWDQEEMECKQSEKIFVKKKSQVTCKNGKKRWYEIKASVIDTIHVVAFVDLDKEISLQEELKKTNKNNDRMLSILGHDLRGPINNLSVISSMVLEDQISRSEFNTLIQMMNVQSNQVLEMLESTLNWAKLNFNSLEQNDVEIDVEAIIQKILGIHKEGYHSKNITVNVTINNDFTLISDKEIFTVICRNIITNAIKFTPINGEITIVFQNNTLTIKDNGIGMSAEMISNILNKNFFTASRMGTDNESGNGMGLQLALDLANKINCKVAIESEQFKGTVFRLSFRS